MTESGDTKGSRTLEEILAALAQGQQPPGETLGPGRIRIGAVEMDLVHFSQALDAIELLVRQGKGGSVYTPNVDHIVMADSNGRFRAAYDAASLSLVDGKPVQWASRLLGLPLPEKISGSDLVWPLMDRCALCDMSVYLLGGGPGSAEKAADAIHERFPAIRIVGIDAPRINVDDPPERHRPIVERIVLAKPDIVLVGLGAPKQEIWIHEHLDDLRPAVLLGIGAAIDFMAGKVQRAPGWISRIGAEWLYRLAQEPRRLAARYLVRDPFIAPLLGRELLRHWSAVRRGDAIAPRPSRTAVPPPAAGRHPSMPPPRRADAQPETPPAPDAESGTPSV
jgi:N-acetylglucosaminyldiphosphoundecaprenol N-acetyl-beta-D-mannosaminyltransferase